MDQKTNKETTLEDLVIMVAEGFQGVNERMDNLENEMQGLRSSVNNYLKLSDERYLELKAREKVIISWVKKIAEKTGVEINLQDLEKTT